MAIHMIERTGKQLVLTMQEYSLFVYSAVTNLFRPPRYWPDFLIQSDIIGFGSAFIVLLSGFFTGGVLALQSAATLSEFGATAMTGRFVSLTMIRELGPVLTGIMVSGRNASSMASELGSMVVTEQIDAMRALGVDPLRKLVTPRLFACISMLFFLTIVADAFGIVAAAPSPCLSAARTAHSTFRRLGRPFAIQTFCRGWSNPFFPASLSPPSAAFMA